MHQWWEALGQLYKMLQDADALALSREARRRLIIAIGALDAALLNCATADCPIRSVVLESRPGGGRETEPDSSAVAVAQPGADSSVESCRTCRWWNDGRAGTSGEGMCLLTRTESREADGPPIAVNTLARATASDARVGAVLVTRLSYACSQWTPL